MIEVDSSGLTIQTYEEILEDIQEEFRSRISTAIATSLGSMAGQLQRIMALREYQAQERALALYQALDPRLSEGVFQDRQNALLGLERLPNTSAVVSGTATGTSGTVINNGVLLTVGGSQFAVTNGPYTIGAGGTVSGVELTATEFGEVDVATLGAWTIDTPVTGFDSFADDSQSIYGRLVETSTEYRTRAEVERYRRSSQTLRAIEASVSSVEGVTYARAWDNITTEPTDADGIPYGAINVVAEGGTDADVAQAILDAAPAGHDLYGWPTPSGSFVSVTIGSGTLSEIVEFNRVTEFDLWIRVSVVTSTSEELAPDDADLEAAIDAALLEYTTANWQIGTDVLPYKLIGAISAAGIDGIDSITVEHSTTSGSGPWSSAKLPISIRQRAVYSSARLVVPTPT